MASIFISHSQHDKNLVEFFSIVFAGTKVKAHFEEFEKFGTGVVTASKIIQDIQGSSALFVLLTSTVAKIAHTRDWVTWESGVGRQKDIWVFESLRDSPNIQIAIPHLSHYVLYETSDSWRSYLTKVVNSYDDSSLLPTLLTTAGTGAAVAKDTLVGILVGGLAGLVLHQNSRGQPTGIRVTCPNCALSYAVHLPGSFRNFRCPSCNLYLTLPHTAGALLNPLAQNSAGGLR